MHISDNCGSHLFIENCDSGSIIMSGSSRSWQAQGIGERLCYSRLESAVDVSFWFALRDAKLNQLRLSEAPVRVHGFATFTPHLSVRARVQLDHSSLAALTPVVSPGYWYMPGTLLNVNTNAQFARSDPNGILEDAAKQIWKDISSGEAFQNPSLLNRFLVLSFADLKKYRFQYWFSFPALFPNHLSVIVREHVLLADRIDSQTQLQNLLDQTRQFVEETSLPSPFFAVQQNVADSSYSVCPLSAFSATDGVWMIGFLDPSAKPDTPSWLLRNLLLCLRAQFNLEHVTLLCLRSLHYATSKAGAPSTIMTVQIEEVAAAGLLPNAAAVAIDALPCVGWERNKQKKPGPRMVDLSSVMNPQSLASSSLDLNLRLMRWRQLPSLDLEVLSSTKCLLLGAGTLGCSVARTLMGWGVRHITFVDSGRVSYSNPARQSLFEFEDCQNGGLFKAEAAATRLKRIFPGMTSTGHVLSIAMPGHPVADVGTDEMDRTTAEIDHLNQLVEDHDVVFMLTDSRESRWLPTVLCAHHDKLLINIALGFDTFVVLRHGHRPVLEEDEERGSNLGCYFCPDVAAPADSLQERTLDQQCTVTRPGLASIASSIGVELMIALLHHPSGHHAPADAALSVFERPKQPLGILPHQVRGWLSHFDQKILIGPAFSQCSACSNQIVKEFGERKAEFVLEVMNSPTVLERLCGLEKMKAEQDQNNWDLDSLDDSDEADI